ncbi:MAG: hypothetical protein F4X64_15910 [Chloroflexi bacterium]|nr:hypothetical protein [Chloroflexota bacterium]
MTSVTEIQEAILNLTAAEYAELMKWLDELEEDPWDRQIEEDVKAGRLDFFKEKVMEAKENGTLGYL